MDITKLCTLCTSLKDTHNELTKVERELKTNQGKIASDVEEVIWETMLQGFNLATLSSAVERINNLYKDSDKYDIDNSWFSVSSYEDLIGNYETLQLKAYKLYTEQENQNIREVLVDKHIKLVTMCADLEKQIKEITNV